MFNWGLCVVSAFVGIGVVLVGCGDYPIVGIVAQPTVNPEYGESFIPASYIKMVESANARVIPLPYRMKESELGYLLDRINGVIFPGGDYRLNLNRTEYFLFEEKVFNYAVQANKKGDHFPVWTECMGFEGLVNIVAGKNVLNVDVKCYEVSLPLIWFKEKDESRFYKDMPLDIREIFEKQNVAFNWHTAGVLVEDYLANNDLVEFFNLVAINDWKEKTFVSVIESKKYPIWGIQFHPEKQFEWKVGEEGINHSVDSHTANLHLADFFILEARKSKHEFEELKDEQKYLMFNYHPAFTSRIGGEYPDYCHYEQTYFFDSKR